VDSLPHPASHQVTKLPARTAVQSSASPVSSMPSPTVTPHRCRGAPSVDSLELSQSMLRYSSMLSSQRARNAEYLEKATSLTREFDELLSCGVELEQRIPHL